MSDATLPVNLGMTRLPRPVESWLTCLPHARLVQMARSVRETARVIDAGDRYMLVQMAAKSAEAVKVAADFETNGRLSAAQEEDMTPKQIAAATGPDLLARYNELTPNKPRAKFKTIEEAREKVTEAEAKAKADEKAAKKAEGDAAKAAAKAEKQASQQRIREEKLAAKQAAGDTGEAGAKRGRAKKEFYITGSEFVEGATAANSKVRDDSTRGQVLAAIKAKGADGILKSDLDAMFSSEFPDTFPYIQKLAAHFHVVLDDIAPEEGAESAAGEAAAA